MGNTCSCSCIENYNYEKLLKRRCPYCNFTIVHDNPPDYLNYLQTGTDMGNSKIINYKEFGKVLAP